MLSYYCMCQSGIWQVFTWVANATVSREPRASENVAHQWNDLSYTILELCDKRWRTYTAVTLTAVQHTQLYNSILMLCMCNFFQCVKSGCLYLNSRCSQCEFCVSMCAPPLWWNALWSSWMWVSIAQSCEILSHYTCDPILHSIYFRQ